MEMTKSRTRSAMAMGLAGMLAALSALAAPVFAAPENPAEPTTELGKLAASLKPGEMKELKTKGYTREMLQSWYEWDHDEKGNRLYGAQKMFNIMTGGWANDGKWDPKTRQALFVGIGHYAAMKFVTYAADSNKWTLEPVPPPLDPRNKDAIQCGIENGRRVWPRGHTYDLQAISPEHRIFVLRWSRGLNVYDIDKKEWRLISNLDLNWQLARDQIEYFPEMKGFVGGLGGSVLLCSPPASKDGQWTRRSLGSAPGIALHGVMEHNPVHKVMVFGGGTPKGNLFRLDTGGKITKLTPPPGCLACVSTAKFMCDPVSGEYICVTEDGDKKGSTKTYAFHPIRDEWKEIPKLRFPTGVAVPVDTYGVLMICTGGQVFVYKHKPVWTDEMPAVTPGAPSGK
jgi:hypothetical protein